VLGLLIGKISAIKLSRYIPQDPWEAIEDYHIRKYTDAAEGHVKTD
jgi:hypothetical protein